MREHLQKHKMFHKQSLGIPIDVNLGAVTFLGKYILSTLDSGNISALGGNVLLSSHPSEHT